jgi:hypothetical protein
MALRGQGSRRGRWTGLQNTVRPKRRRCRRPSTPGAAANATPPLQPIACLPSLPLALVHRGRCTFQTSVSELAFARNPPRLIFDEQLDCRANDGVRTRNRRPCEGKKSIRQNREQFSTVRRYLIRGVRNGAMGGAVKPPARSCSRSNRICQIRPSTKLTAIASTKIRAFSFPGQCH